MLADARSLDSPAAYRGVGCARVADSQDALDDAAAETDTYNRDRLGPRMPFQIAQSKRNNAGLEETPSGLLLSGCRPYRLAVLGVGRPEDIRLCRINLLRREVLSEGLRVHHLSGPESCSTAR